MSDNLVPFWEKSYQENDTITFSDKPNSTIVEFEYLIGNLSKVLDVGCGEGQNAVYLARQGHQVDAFDLSEHGIAKLKHICELSNVQLNAFVADLNTYQFDQCYDMVICFGTLPASEDIAPFAIGLAKDEELKELYADWEILQFKSYVFEDEHPNVPKHLHASNKIVARKVK